MDEGPTIGRFFACIVNRRVYANNKTAEGVLNGKISCLWAYNTKILIDDNVDIANECLKGGIVVYLIQKGRERDHNRWAPRILNQGRLSHYSHPSFEEAFLAVVNDASVGKLGEKIRILNLPENLYYRPPKPGTLSEWRARYRSWVQTSRPPNYDPADEATQFASPWARQD